MHPILLVQNMANSKWMPCVWPPYSLDAKITKALIDMSHVFHPQSTSRHKGNVCFIMVYTDWSYTWLSIGAWQHLRTMPASVGSGCIMYSYAARTLTSYCPTYSCYGNWIIVLLSFCLFQWMSCGCGELKQQMFRYSDSNFHISFPVSFCRTFSSFFVMLCCFHTRIFFVF